MLNGVLLTYMRLGEKLKQLRESRGWSQRALSQIAGVDRSLINQIETGARNSASLGTLIKFSKAFEVNLDELTTNIESYDAPLPVKPFSSIINELKERYEALSLVEIPVIGVVPCGTPFPVDQVKSEEFAYVPRLLLNGANFSSLYALTAHGDSLQGDDVFDGDHLIVDPSQRNIVDGKIYAVRLGNETCARHVSVQDGHLRLESSHKDYRVIEASEVEILGRVVLSGRWKKV